jgi:kynurenine formamidase
LVKMERLIDLSQMIEDDMPVYPGDVRTSLFQNKYLNVNAHNNHRLEISMHSGTHIDGPMHLTESDEYIYEMPLQAFIGIGCILDVRGQTVIRKKPEYEEQIMDNSIVLLYTGWDRVYGTKEYYEEHPVVDIGFCDMLVRKNIKLFGMDIPSPDRYPFDVHKTLLSNKIFIAENLTNLDKLNGVHRFEVIAFPLKMKADSSMARVVARILE